MLRPHGRDRRHLDSRVQIVAVTPKPLPRWEHNWSLGRKRKMARPSAIAQRGDVGEYRHSNPNDNTQIGVY